MASRLLASAILLLAGLVAWLTVTWTPAARLLQAAVALSIVYVAYLAWHGWRAIRAERRADITISADARSPRPWVTIVVPARNEAGVIGHSIGDLLAQRYADAAGARYDLLVVDDGSSDGTGEVALALIGAHGDNARVVRRDADAQPHTKGAALAFAHPFVRGEILGVIDADTRLDPDFLERVMAAWDRDPGAVAIQAQRRALDPGSGWLAAAQDAEQLMDMASQCGRRTTDGVAELRGNGMFVRVAALVAVGGWNVDALTEDLDLSGRLAAAGQHVALAPDAELREEAVVGVGDLWRQRLRWAEGGLRRLLEVGPQLLRSPVVPLSRKLDFAAFAVEYLIPPLFIATIAASLVTIPLPGPAEWTVPISLFVAYGGGCLLLALAGLASHEVRGIALLGSSLRGALFLSHWLVVVPAALARIAVGPPTGRFVRTPRRQVASRDR